MARLGRGGMTVTSTCNCEADYSNLFSRAKASLTKELSQTLWKVHKQQATVAACGGGHAAEERVS